MVVFFSGLLVQCSDKPKNRSITLKGEWKLRLDSADSGVKEQWYTKNFSKTLNLPGSLQAQGYGNNIDSTTPWTGDIKKSYFNSIRYKEYQQKGEFKVPFWLNPKKYYKGVAWYQKQVDIPNDWENQKIFLYLERPHWETTVYVNNKEIGSRNSLSTPHQYDLTDSVSPGKNRLTVRVDNRMIVNIGKNSHSITDHTQSNWNGIAGDIKLKAKPLVYIEDIQIYPDISNECATVEIQLRNESVEIYRGKIALKARTKHTERNQVLPRLEQSFQMGESRKIRLNYPMGENPMRWSEFDPNLYSMHVSLYKNESEPVDTASEIFGMRNFYTRGSRFMINHRPVFLRGTLECAIFPNSGYPPTDTAAWGRIFRTIKRYGLNHMRFHSWCPPEAAFTVADREGVYLQVECASWANQGAKLGAGLPVDQWIYEESRKIVKEYGNHPSFCMMAYGNEPGGKNQKEYLAGFVEYWKNKDNRRVYTSASGWPMIDASQFHVSPQPRIQRWGEGLNSIINKEPPNTTFDHTAFVSQYDVPVVGHEIGQWCVYPDYERMEKYTGVLQPDNFYIFRDMLKDNNMIGRAEKFYMASGKLQALCYKADIEAALRTPDFAGFQLLDLHDFPGQGTALVGVTDPFWDSKDYISAEEYREFAGETVPLAKMKKRLYRNSETFKASLLLSHFGSSALINVSLKWKIENDSGEILKEGEFPGNAIRYDNNQKIGDIEFDLSNLDNPQKLTLTVTLPEHGTNSWDFWVYPDQLDMPQSENILLAEEVNTKVRQSLSRGKKVLMMVHDRVKDDKGGNVKVGFSPVFWNTMWTNNQPPHTMGILCDPDHAVFNHFPTEYHSNWQWWDVVTGSQVMNMEDFPREIRPLIQSIPDYHKNRKLAFAFEGNVGKGKLLVTSIDFTGNLEEKLATRQLYYSMLNYMMSGQFAPNNDISLDTIEKILN
jgi:hypothetical protein